MSRIVRLNIQAQLGNQMFQYAAIRTYAEATNSRLTWGYPRTTFANRLRLLFGRMRRPRIRLRQYFRLDSDERLYQLWNNAAWLQRRLSHPAVTIRPKYEEVLPRAFSEKLVDLTEIAENGDLEFSGWFQSEQYFLHNRANVLRWFTPLEKISREIDEAEQLINIPADQRCCIHVRRSDYLQCDAGFAGPEGWALPMIYYQNAWREVLKGIIPIIITDDPIYCKQSFGWLPNVQIVEGTSAIVDLFLMRNSRYRIIANSTFSWWGAWLAENPNGVTLVPEGFLGFVRRVWVPSHIKPKTWIAVRCDSDYTATKTRANQS